MLLTSKTSCVSSIVGLFAFAGIGWHIGIMSNNREYTTPGEFISINRETISAKVFEGDDVLRQHKVDMFDFVPNNVQDCKKLFGGNKNISASLSAELETYNSAFREQTNKTPWHGDGYTAMYPEIFKVATTIANFSFINTICETGFNTGHSTFGWLVANSKANVYSFDLDHDYGRPMGHYLQARFPGRLNITWGNSVDTLPKFRQDHSHVTCDLIVIDGGHSYKDSNSDLLNFRMMASPENIVMMDDYVPKHAKVSRTWAEAKKRGDVAEIFTCTVGHGFAVGRFIV